MYCCTTRERKKHYVFSLSLELRSRDVLQRKVQFNSIYVDKDLSLSTRGEREREREGMINCNTKTRTTLKKLHLTVNIFFFIL